ncbi:hypothetical protein KBB89_03155 [Candidatus Gracilibacteria bacterium]|nr:hypothetical protein [Candidatus Gracilibacteria bacterium]
MPETETVFDYENPATRKTALQGKLFPNNSFVDGVTGFSGNVVYITSEEKRESVLAIIETCPLGNELLGYIRIQVSGEFVEQY